MANRKQKIPLRVLLLKKLGFRMAALEDFDHMVVYRRIRETPFGFLWAKRLDFGIQNVLLNEDGTVSSLTGAKTWVKRWKEVV